MKIRALSRTCARVRKTKMTTYRQRERERDQLKPLVGQTEKRVIGLSFSLSRQLLQPITKNSIAPHPSAHAKLNERSVMPGRTAPSYLLSRFKRMKNSARPRIAQIFKFLQNHIDKIAHCTQLSSSFKTISIFFADCTVRVQPERGSYFALVERVYTVAGWRAC